MQRTINLDALAPEVPHVDAASVEHSRDPFDDGHSVRPRARESALTPSEIAAEVERVHGPEIREVEARKGARIAGMVRRMHEDRIRQGAELEAAQQRQTSRPRRKPYTTQYAVDWARRQGWRVIRREGFDARTRRHYDLEYGMDVLATDGRRLIYIQAAGTGERAEHRQRFDLRHGAEAVSLGHRIIYAEFERESRDPVRTEEWGS